MPDNSTRTQLLIEMNSYVRGMDDSALLQHVLDMRKDHYSKVLVASQNLLLAMLSEERALLDPDNRKGLGKLIIKGYNG